MAASVEKIINGILKVKEKAAKNETEAVQLQIELGRAIVRLKKKVPRGWYLELSKLGYHPRVTNRYHTIGEHWSNSDRTPGSGLMSQMPVDLQKLEMLCRLSVAQLEEFCKVIPPRSNSRGRVIEGVRNLLGLGASKEEHPLKPEAICKQLDHFADKLLEALEKLDEPDRARILTDLESRLVELPEKLRSVGVDEDEEDEDEEGEDDENATDGTGPGVNPKEDGEAEEAPAPIPRSSRPAPRNQPNARTAGKQRGSAQPV